MKNLYVQFGEEKKQHLNYLGSMLGRPNTPEEQEMEDILEAIEKGARSKESLDSLAKRQDHAFQQVALIYSLIKATEGDRKKDWEPGAYEYVDPKYVTGTHPTETGDVTWHTGTLLRGAKPKDDVDKLVQ